MQNAIRRTGICLAVGLLLGATVHAQGVEEDAYHEAVRRFENGESADDDDLRFGRFPDTPAQEELVALVVEKRSSEFLSLFSRRLERIREEQDKIFLPNSITERARTVELWGFSDAMWSVFMTDVYWMNGHFKKGLGMDEASLVLDFVQTGLSHDDLDIRLACIEIGNVWLMMLGSDFPGFQLSGGERQTLLTKTKDILAVVEGRIIPGYEPFQTTLNVQCPDRISIDEGALSIFSVRDPACKARWAAAIWENYRNSLKNTEQHYLETTKERCRLLIKRIGNP